MSAHDDRTARGYPVPNPANTLREDRGRIADAIGEIDRDLTAAEQATASVSARATKLEKSRKTEALRTALGLYPLI
ncbi:hypothetical protein PMNALOAF_2763 [Methylobacterium adhaesivum]|uniref:Uncharacterized protein n=1 Tax=Methylobacterium adhaesivum TaxID=333297 RepID=A0ABT8BLB6_9HYPH|nr:hypothetical protein [Methylobacterium adhaesivum]MDN3592116.1 hypothetical protein [Methylobacterium adhaesivum]GJD31504.1 hypothetical protein PMNALOAF_2763 [Methylobacterium adhaesivum]